ncbi:MAG TPA: phenylalanine--tRNA ligase subunit alpha [Acidobacteriota bacterium]|nr:phenylalanine--tRNA ligase subunit alpha [Acidobacteriota bacterium]
MQNELILDENAYAVWEQLLGSDGPLKVAELEERTGVDQSQVTAAATQAAQQGYFKVEERERQELVADPQAEAVLAKGLPERQALQFLAESGQPVPNGQLAGWANKRGLPPNEVFKYGPMRGWMKRVKSDQGAALELTDLGNQALEEQDDDEKALRLAIEAGGAVYLDDLQSRGVDPARVEKLLGNRDELAKIKDRTQRLVSLTDQGRRMMEEERVKVKREQTALSSDDITSGAWRDITLRRYDVTLPAETAYPAKIHPMRKIMEETRRAFLEMGFSEVVSPMVESAFWNFDALFQPQDHPARDMQDTFYMEHPRKVDLPEEKWVEPVKRTHEDGWKTGSEGWGYKWDAETSRRVVLRTHTTASTIRALAAHPQPPGKFFAVGWTFRNETISYKHLPVFHQVDGIVIDEEANLATLLGTLQAFYHKMGFGKVRFKPAFYPYTEPSVDVVVYMESRGKWLEMGGSGIFRPEVTEPLGCKHPVLAWGLGIERLAMLRYGLNDIRELYRSNLDTLEEVALCR